MAAAPALVPGMKVTISGKEALGVGILRFYGETKFRPGNWAGVEIATPQGKNDGSVQGVRYFKCKDKHGIFVPGHTVAPVQRAAKPAAADSVAKSPKPVAKSPKPAAKKPVAATPKAAAEKPAAKPKAAAEKPAARPKAVAPKAATGPTAAEKEAIAQKAAAEAEKVAAEQQKAAAEKQRAAAEKQRAAAEADKAALEKEKAAAEKEREAADKQRAAAEKETAAAEQERLAAAARADAARKQTEEAEASRAAAAAAAESARLGQAAAEAEAAKAKAVAAAQAAAAMQDKEQAEAAMAKAAEAAKAAEVALQQQAAAKEAQATAEKERAAAAAQTAAALAEKEEAEAAQAKAASAAKQALAEKAAAEEERAAAHAAKEKASKAAEAALREKEAALKEQQTSDRLRAEAEKAQAEASRKAEAALQQKAKAEEEKAAALQAKDAAAEKAASALKDRAAAEAAAKAAQEELQEQKDAMAEFRTSSKALQLEVTQLREEVAELREAKAAAEDAAKGKLANKAASLKDTEAKLAAQKAQIAALEKEKSKLATQQQREAEKVAAAHKKELDALLERAEEAEFNLENMQLDLEMAEEASSNFESEVETLRGRLEIAEAQASTSRSVDTEAGGEEPAASDEQLKENNTRLTAALMKLRDLSLAEKQTRDRRIKELEKENMQLPKLEEKLLQLETDLLQAEDNVEELKEQLDVALEAADVVDELSEKNMDLEDTVAELKQTVEDMEEMRDLSEELEAQQADTEKQLRKDLLLLEIKLQDQETVIGNVVAKIKDQEETIVRYRGKVEELKGQLFVHSADHQEKSAQAESLEGKATKLLEENISMRSQLEKLQGAAVEKTLGDLQMAAAEKRVQMLSAYVPADVIKEDREAIDCHFLLQKLKDKCSLIGGKVKADNHIHDFIPATASDRNVDDRYFAYKLVRLLDAFELSATQLLHYLETVPDADAWLEIRKIQWDLSGHTRVLDTLLQALLQGELSVSFDLLPLENATKTLYNIGERFHALPLTRPISSGSQAIAYGSQFVSMELSRLQRAMALNAAAGLASGDALQDVAHTAAARGALKPLLDACKALTRVVGEGDHLGSADDEELTSICSAVSDGRERCSGILQKTHAVLAQVEKALNDLDAEPRNEDQLRVLVADSLEDAAFGESFDSAEPWAGFDAAVASLATDLANVVPALEQWTDKHADASVETREPAQTVRARSIMQELNSLNDLKDQISELAAQAAQQATTLAAQETTIAEAQRTQTLLESRIASLLQREEELQKTVSEKEEELKKQAKTWEDALLSMQEDVDALEADNRTLADKLAQVRKHGGEAGEGTRSAAVAAPGPREGSSAPASSAEVAGLRAGIELLQRENALVRCKQAAAKLQHLAAAPLPRLSPPKPEVVACRKKLLQLNQAAQKAYASPLVVSLVNSRDGPTPATQRKAELSVLSRDAAKARDALAAALQPQLEGSQPSVRLLSKVAPVGAGRLIGKITLPGDGSSQPVRLPLNQEGLHKLHSRFA